MIQIQNLVQLSLKALRAIETGAEHVISLATEVREAATATGQWLPEHEAVFSNEITRLTGTAPVAPVTASATTPVAEPETDTAPTPVADAADAAPVQESAPEEPKA